MRLLLLALLPLAPFASAADTKPSADSAKAAEAAKAERDKLPPKLWPLFDAAEGGNVRMQFLLGNYYQYGVLGMKKNPEHAEKWYKKAVEQGDTEAMLGLARLMREGSLGKTDLAGAFKLARQAADKGHPDGYAMLGYAYFEGSGVSKSVPEGLKALTKGASLGSVDAVFQLASRYHYGSGVKQDYTEAYKWYTVAGELGIAAQASIADLTSHMSTAAASRAARLATEYLKANPVKRYVPNSAVNDARERSVITTPSGATGTTGMKKEVNPDDPFEKAAVKK